MDRVTWQEQSLDDIGAFAGRVAVVVAPDGKMGPEGRKVNSLTKRALSRLVESESWAAMAEGDAVRIDWPAGMECDAVIIVKLAKRSAPEVVVRAGAQIVAAGGKGDLLVLAGATETPENLGLGLVLRRYRYEAQKSGAAAPAGAITVMVKEPVPAIDAWPPCEAVAAGACLTRDLVNAPANVLTTDAFVAELEALRGVGLEVEVLDEGALEALGMGSLLCVGQGSKSPSYVVAMKWMGGAAEAAPLALVGKGVVFDTGGISLKRAPGMEEMTMDMGGAAVVAGAMRAIAGRGARANVLGIVGIVENMPSGRAVRPGDVVTSMKGDTIEVINTDAEGRLVLADVLWYAQQTYAPTAIIDLATLTGAVVVSLGAEHAGLFGNDDHLVAQIMGASQETGEAAWRMPMGAGYGRRLKSRIADIKNVGGRDGGASVAAEFLGRFVEDTVPWCHLDIAGVTLAKSGRGLAPAGATGWGVRLLDRLVADHFEAD